MSRFEELVLENDRLRNLFKEKCPDINKIKQSDIHKLLWLLDMALEKHSEGDNLHMNMVPLNSLVAKMIREKGMAYKGLELKVRAHYFERGRDAITFTKEGSVFFCGWAGGNNHIPFLSAFEQWVNELQFN